VKAPSRFYVVSLDNRKARGSGHERPEEILAAARELFLAHGVESVSTRQIAKRVGISQTALYVYFKSKEDMLDELAEAAFRKLGAALSSVEARCPDPVDYLRATVQEYIRFGLENPDEYRLAFLLRDGRRKAPRSNDQEPPAGLMVFAAVESRIASGLQTGALRTSGSSARGAAQALWAAIHGLVALQLAYPDFGWVPVEDLIGIQTDMILSGLINSEKPSHVAPRKRAPDRHKAAAGARRGPTNLSEA
jgi:AcrR family transcriptional regulator